MLACPPAGQQGNADEPYSSMSPSIWPHRTDLGASPWQMPNSSRQSRLEFRALFDALTTM